MKTPSLSLTDTFLNEETNKIKKSEPSQKVLANQIILSITMLLLISGAAFVYYLQPEFYNFNQSRINSPIGFAFFVITIVLLIF